MDHDGSFYSYAMDSKIHNNVTAILASILAENGLAHYETIIRIAEEKGYRIVGKYFSDFDTSERYWFFKDRPGTFVVTKSGYVIPSDYTLQRFREEKESEVIDYFVGVLKTTPEMEILKLVKKFQKSDSNAKHYFDFCSTSDLYSFFKNRPAVFLVKGIICVSLREEINGASEHEEILDSDLKMNEVRYDISYETSEDELSDENSSVSSEMYSDASSHSMAADEICNEQETVESRDEISDAGNSDNENPNAFSSEAYSFISSCSGVTDETGNGQANGESYNEINEAESDNENSDTLSEADSDTLSEADTDTRSSSDETDEIGNSQANGNNEITDSDDEISNDSSELYCDTHSTFSNSVIFPENNVVDILTSILVRCGSMHYQALIKKALSKDTNSDVVKYFSSLDSSQKFWFFRNRPLNFVIANSGYVLPSDPVLDRFKQIELDVIDYFVAFLKATPKMHFLKLVKSLRNSDSDAKHYFDSASDSDIYWFFKNRPATFEVGSDSYVSLPKNQAAPVGKGILNNISHTGKTNYGHTINHATNSCKCEQEVLSFEPCSNTSSNVSSPIFLVIDSTEDDTGSLISISHADGGGNYPDCERKDMTINVEAINSVHSCSPFTSEDSIGQASMQTPVLFGLKHAQEMNENSMMEHNDNSGIQVENIYHSSCDNISCLKTSTNMPDASTTESCTLSKQSPGRSKSLVMNQKVYENREPTISMNNRDVDHTTETAIALQCSMQSGLNSKSAVFSENADEDITIQTLSSILKKAGKLHYLLLTNIALEGSNCGVQNYFRNFDFCEKFKFFERHKNVFIIRDNGFVYLTSAALEKFVEEEKEKAERVLNVFVTILKAADGPMHYTELVKRVQISESDVKGYFDSYFRGYQFLKDHSSLFVIDSNCYVRLSETACESENERQNSIEESQLVSPLIVKLIHYNDKFTQTTEALCGVTDNLDQDEIENGFTINAISGAMSDSHMHDSFHEIRHISYAKTEANPDDKTSESVESSKMKGNSAVLSLTEAHIQSVRYFVILLRKWKNANYHKLLYKVCRYDRYISDFFAYFTLSDVLEFIRMHSMYFSVQDDKVVKLVDSKITPSNVFGSEDHVREVVSSMEEKAVEYFVTLLRQRKCLLLRDLECYLGSAPGYVISFFVANYYGEDFSKFFEQQLNCFHIRSDGYIGLSSETSKNESFENFGMSLIPTASLCTIPHKSKEDVLNRFNTPSTNNGEQENSDQSSDSGCP